MRPPDSSAAMFAAENISSVGRAPAPAEGFPYWKPGLAKPSGEIKMSFEVRAGNAAANRHAILPPIELPMSDRLLDAQLVHQFPDECDTAGVTVVSRAIGLREAAAGQIKPHHPIVCVERPGPGFPRFDARAESVDENQCRRILGTGISNAQRGAADLEEPCRGIRILLLEIGARPIRRPRPDSRRDDRRRKQTTEDEQHAFHQLPLPDSPLNDRLECQSTAVRSFTEFDEPWDGVKPGVWAGEKDYPRIRPINRARPGSANSPVRLRATSLSRHQADCVLTTS